MIWCPQAASHYLSKCRPRSISTYGVTRPQWVNELFFYFHNIVFPVISLAYLLPLPLSHLPQQKTPAKLANLYNKSIADAHPSFLLEEAILFQCCWQKRNIFPSACRMDCLNVGTVVTDIPAWWRHQMETFSALLAICVGNSPVTGEFPAQRPVTRSFRVFFNLRLNKPSSKQLWGWWFETLSPHYDIIVMGNHYIYALIRLITSHSLTHWPLWDAIVNSNR